ncbi:MAG: Na+/H+ antiporter NhaA [Hyphomicrobiaceae bacterium]
MIDIARQINPLLRGWIEYYGRYSRAAVGPILRYVNQTVMAWMARKFKRFIGRKAKGHMYGAAILAGIGFTMSLFIGTLAFEGTAQAAAVRLGVLSGSTLSAIVGYLVLRTVTKNPIDAADHARVTVRS